jgi:hypothetical protein
MATTGADTTDMDITFREPEHDADGRSRIFDSWADRWMILVDTDGTCSIKDYHEDVEDWIAHDLTLAEAKAEVQRLYDNELARGMFL